MKPIATAATVLCLTFSCSALADYSAVITSNATAVYSDAAMTDQVSTLSKNTVVLVTGDTGTVSLIRLNGKNGYVASSALTSVESVAISATVTAKTRVYKKASKSATSASIPKGLVVNLVAQKDSWSCIEYKGKVGYIPTVYLDTGSTDSDEADKKSSEEASSVSFEGTDCADFTAMATSKTYIYSSPSTSSSKAVIAIGTQVTVTAYNDTWACVKKDSATGYMKRADLAVVCSIDATAKSATKVYKSSSTSSRLLGTMKSGTSVTIVAFTDTWARVTRSGKTGFCLLSSLDYSASGPYQKQDDASTGTDTSDDEQTVPTYSNEEIWEETTGGADPSSVLGSTGAEYTYNYLRNVMGLNTAAACGVMASIVRESDYDPTSLNSSGHYGICQWGGSRRTNLVAIATAAGYDPATLTGQLYFLQYEMQHSYSRVWNKLTAVPNSAQGAYDAAYYFSYYFEVPSNREASSISRGILAAEKLFPKYSS